MARTTLTPNVLTANNLITNTKNDGTNFTATDNTNGMTVAITTNTIPAGGSADRILFVVLNTAGTGYTFTIRGATSDGGASKLGAGTASAAFTYPGFEGGKGDVTSSALTATTGIGFFGPFEVARFMQPDGTISIDFSGNAGYVKALLLPRAF